MTDSSKTDEELCYGIPWPLHELILSKKDQAHWDRMVERLIAANAIKGHGHDLILRIYLTGLWHGSVIGKE